MLDANLLERIANTRRINGVVLSGRFFDRRALDDLLAKLALCQPILTNQIAAPS